MHPAPSRSAELTETIRSQFLLDPHTTFLNHGSFGACPRKVLDVQRDIRHRMEQQPVRFFMQRYFPLLDAARLELANFVNVDPDRLAFVPNATTGVSTVLRSLDLEPGDELLTTSHDYPACRNALEFVAEKHGAQVVVADVPFPDCDDDSIVQAVVDRVTPRTRLALIDWVSSFTAMVFPVETLVARLNDLGVETLVDGAHALAMIDVDLDSVRPTYFVANCHKWLCSPKGAGILVVDARAQSKIRPLSISFGSTIPIEDRSVFQREFDWQGTIDPSPFIAAGKAIDLMATMVPGGWPAIRQYNHNLVCYGRDRILATLGADAPIPTDQLGSMASIPLPDAEPRPASGYLPSDALYEALVARKFEVPVFQWPVAPRRWLRISAQIYNEPQDYDRLAVAVRESLASG